MLTNVMIGAAVLLGLGGLLWSQQRVLMYHPNPQRVAPEAVGLREVEEILLRAPDGIEVIAWYGVALPGQPTILYFHGNASNLAGRAGRVGEYLAKGRGMLMMSYRGYSGSGGKPTEAHNVADARRAYDWLRARGVPARDIVVYGESLGSGVAVQLADDVEVGGIILDAPFTSIVEVGQRIYPYLPVRTFIFDRYDSLSRIAGIRAPLLIVHGDQDELIPIEMGRELFAAAPEPKTFAAIEGAGHADHYLFGSYDVIHAWIDRHWPARGLADREGAMPANEKRAKPDLAR